MLDGGDIRIGGRVAQPRGDVELRLAPITEVTERVERQAADVLSEQVYARPERGLAHRRFGVDHHARQGVASLPVEVRTPDGLERKSAPFASAEGPPQDACHSLLPRA